MHREFIERALEEFGRVDWVGMYLPAVLMVGEWEKEWKVKHPEFVSAYGRWNTQYEDLGGDPDRFDHISALIDQEEPGLMDEVNRGELEMNDDLALKMLGVYEQSGVTPSTFLTDYISARSLLSF